METIQYILVRPNLYLFLIALLSLTIGSFLNVVIYRLPLMMKNAWNLECRQYLGLKISKKDTERLNLWLPFSHCTHCKKRLKAWHNIPILSFFILRARCAYCHMRFSARYLLVELLCCATSVYIAAHFGVSLQTLLGLIFTWIAIALIFIDLDHHLLPDNLTLLLLWISLIASLFHVFASTHDAIIGAAVGYLLFAGLQGTFHLLTGKVGMGQGDYKFLAAMGALLGWQLLPVLILLASFIGLIFGLVHIGIRHQFKSVPIPFGPYLAISGWICLVSGNDILHVLSQYYL